MKQIAAILFITTLSLAAGAQTNDAQALVQLGRDAVTHGEPEKAAECFEKAVAPKPNNAGRISAACSIAAGSLPPNMADAT